MRGRGSHGKVCGELKGGYLFDSLAAWQYPANVAWQVFSIFVPNLMRAMQVGTVNGELPREAQTVGDTAVLDYPDSALRVHQPGRFAGPAKWPPNARRR